MPEVSVIITTYNYGHMLAESIDSVMTQDYDDFELIVVDDGSTDNTSEVVSRYGDRIRYVRQDHSGIAAARNHGIAEAKADLIAFQDADDLWAPNTLSLRVQSIKRHPELGLVFGDAIVLRDGEIVVHSFLKERAVLRTLDTVCERGYLRIISESAFPALLKERFIPIPSIIIPKQRFDEVGPWDASFEGVEDYEFYLRLSKRFRLGYLDRVLVTCRIHGANVSCSVSKQNERRINLLRRFEDDPQLSPSDRRALRRRLSELHVESAWHEKEEGRIRAARSSYMRAWSYNRGRFGALLRSCALAVLPGDAITTGRGAADG